MAKRMMDIALDGGDDLKVTGGDFGVVESTYQHQRQLLLNTKGEFKESPTVCVGAVNFIDDDGKEGITGAITREFMRDGMEVENLTRNEDSLVDDTVAPFVNAYYL